MMRRYLLAAILLSVAVSSPAVTTNDAVTAETQGRELAQQLRNLQPPEGFTNSATLQIRGKGRRADIPLTALTSVSETNWQTTYIAQTTNGLAYLSVRHLAGQPNGYHLDPGCSDSEAARARLMSPFAGSDFWVVDLALDFLHWPAQKVWRKELKKGQSCAVLESRLAAPATNGYSRVVSWVDIDTGGIVQAEAYDAKGKLLKEFEVKELEKINGRLEVTEIQMRNVQTGSRTTLRFNFAPSK